MFGLAAVDWLSAMRMNGSRKILRTNPNESRSGAKAKLYKLECVGAERKPLSSFIYETLSQ